MLAYRNPSNGVPETLWDYPETMRLRYYQKREDKNMIIEILFSEIKDITNLYNRDEQNELI